MGSVLFVAWAGVSTNAAANRYQNGFPDTSSFFPIGVWTQSPTNASRFRDLGINTFVGLWKGPTEAQLAELSRQEMYVVAEQNDTALASQNRSVIKAWMQADEPDNAQETSFGVPGACIDASEVARRTREIKTRDRSRPVLLNFGRGVADPFWPGRGRCTGDRRYYGRAATGADILSFDIYPVASDTPHVKGKLEYVGRGVANLLEQAIPGQQVWAAIETTALDPNRPVLPAEVRAEVWMAIIYGARGFYYFVHEWKGGLREDGIFRHPDVVAEVTRINHIIRDLAPVLNSPDAAEGVVVDAPLPIAVLAKTRDDALYLFAVALQNQPELARFTIPGVGDATAAVIDEQRTVAVHDGNLADEFSGYDVHLYRIPHGP